MFLLVLVLVYGVKVPLAHAGFLSQFFANVASDSLKGNGKGSSADPKIKEKKIQAALAVMGFYDGKLDGDFDTFDSRTGIKKLQKHFSLEETGFLSEQEKSQLTYLSNLFVSLKGKEVNEAKKLAIYDEIDSAKKSMLNKGFVEEYLPFFVTTLHPVRIIADLEDAKIWVNNNESSPILLGYSPLELEEGEYEIKIEKLSDDGEWLYSGKKSINVNGSLNSKITFDKAATKKRKMRLAQEAELKRIAAEKEERRLKALWDSSEILEDAENFSVWEDSARVNFKMSPEDAKAYCESLRFSQRENWRIPSSEEVMRFVFLSQKSKNKTPTMWDGEWLLYTKGFMKYDNVRSNKSGVYSHTKYTFRCISDNPDKVEKIAIERKAIAKGLGLKEYPVDTFIDKNKKLMWEAGDAGHRDNKYLDVATKHCKNLTLGNFKDWRLPSPLELRAFFKLLPAGIHFEDRQFWTSETKRKSLRYTSRSDTIGKDTWWHANYRCVRTL